MAAVGEIDVYEFMVGDYGFALGLLHHGRQLLVVAYEHKPPYGVALSVPCRQQSDELRLKYLGSLVDDGEVEMLDAEQSHVGIHG